ncbi:MAG: DEAD/DEAH box helicase [Lentisphaerota bacterium]
MPLQLIKKLAAKLLGRSTTVQTPERPGKPARPTHPGGRSAPASPRKPAASPRDRPISPPTGRPGARTPRPDRPPSPERTAAPGAVGHAPHRDSSGSQRPVRSDRPTHSDRSPRPERHSPGGRPPPPRSGRSDPSSVRPGGAVQEAETTRRREAHAVWSLDQYVVPVVEDKKRFQDFDLPAEILHAVADLKFQYCTPIQAISLEYALAGKNVAGKAQTGTGKTAAFLVALLTRYMRTPDARNSAPGRPRALVIAPTRELVIQICQDADALGKYCGLRYLAIYGGMDYDRQRTELQAGPVDLLVATPGRLLDFVSGKVVDLSGVDTLVIDEADRMLDMGFIPDVKRIIFRLPPKERRCTMLYSATLNDDVMRLASQWMTEPVRVEIESDSMTIDTISQVVYIVRASEKFTVLYNVLKTHADQRVLVFCNRRSSTERVAESLNRLGIPCEMLSGDVQQNRRLRVLEDFKSGKIRVVVATDVAGRGLHVDDIGFVVNFDFPYEADDYVHRIGRTGRAGHTGTAISFADEDESFIIPEIEKFIGEPLKCTMPDEALLLPIPDIRSQHRPPRQEPHHRTEPVSHPVQPEQPHHRAEPVSHPVQPKMEQPHPAEKQPPAVAEEPSRHPVAPAHTPPPPVKRPHPTPPRHEAPRTPVAVVASKRPVTEEWSPGQ